MHNVKKRLLEQGWNKKDINKTLKIIEKAKKHKHPHIKLLDKIVYWLSLLIAIIGNFIISSKSFNFSNFEKMNFSLL